MNTNFLAAKPPAGYAAVHVGIVDLLQAARAQAARSVNALMTASYWEIGRRIVEAEQKGKRRAGYGEQLIAASPVTSQLNLVAALARTISKTCAAST